MILLWLLALDEECRHKMTIWKVVILEQKSCNCSLSLYADCKNLPAIILSTHHSIIEIREWINQGRHYVTDCHTLLKTSSDFRGDAETWRGNSWKKWQDLISIWIYHEMSGLIGASQNCSTLHVYKQVPFIQQYLDRGFCFLLYDLHVIVDSFSARDKPWE